MRYKVFLDECGEHNLTSVDPKQPVFCVAGVIMSEDEYVAKLNQINAVKLKYFNHEGVILRSYNIRNWKQEFHVLSDKAKRDDFYADMNPVLSSGYGIICVSLHKDNYLKKYPKRGGGFCSDLYEICIGIFLERLGYFVEREAVKNIEIIAEGRGKKENASLKKSYENIRNGVSTTFFSKNFKNADVNLIFQEKISNIAGLQLADLVAYPLALYHGGKTSPTFDLIKGNFLYGSERYNFKQLP